MVAITYTCPNPDAGLANLYQVKEAPELGTRFLLSFVVVWCWKFLSLSLRLFHWPCDCPSKWTNPQEHRKWFTQIHKELKYNQNKTQHNTTVCINHDMSMA